MEQKESDGAGSEGRIVLTIRLARTAEAAAPPVEEMKRHYCKLCDKSFGSGKAYGGHVSSAHVQANKDHSYRKLNSKMRKQQHGCGGSDDYTCRHCGKVFWSKKSLFGHMRCHPEREWRGMEPPKPKPDPDSGRNLKDWPAEAKRIRGAVNPNFRSGSAAAEEEEDTVVAGRQLINMLAGKGNPIFPLEKKQKSSESESESGSDGAARAEPPKLPIGIDINDERVLGAVVVLAGGIRNQNRVSGEKMSPKRQFSTHQALGGHRCTVNTADHRTSWIDHTAAAAAAEKVALFDLNMAPEEEDEDGDSPS